MRVAELGVQTQPPHGLVVKASRDQDRLVAWMRVQRPELFPSKALQDIRVTRFDGGFEHIECRLLVSCVQMNDTPSIGEEFVRASMGTNPGNILP